MPAQVEETDAEVELMINERIQKMDKLKQSLKLLKVSLSVFQVIRILIGVSAVKPMQAST